MGGECSSHETVVKASLKYNKWELVSKARKHPFFGLSSEKEERERGEERERRQRRERCGIEVASSRAILLVQNV